MMRKLSFSRQVDRLVNESRCQTAAVDIHDCYCLFFEERRMKSGGQEEKAQCVFLVLPLSFFSAAVCFNY